MEQYRWPRTDGNYVEIAVTSRSEGDFHIDAEPRQLLARRAAVFAGPWSVVRQVHGARVVEADPERAPEADGVFTEAIDEVIAVQGADCAPIGFVTTAGPIGVVHAGWRGLAAGVIEQMAASLTRRGATIDRIVVGPTIGVGCYAFGADDLDTVAAKLGDAVRGATAGGDPALDLAAGIRSQCASLHLGPVEFIGACTSCAGEAFYSHRARKDPERHALAMRITRSSRGAE